MTTKEKRIFASMETDVDAVVLMNGTDPNLDESFFYATGVSNGPFEGCVAIITPKRIEVLGSDLEELSAVTPGIETTAFESTDHRTRLLEKKLKGYRRVGINARALTYENFLTIKKAAKGAKLLDISQYIENARMLKQPDEVARIKRACKIASTTAYKIPEIVAKGETETEAAAELNHMMMRLGATRPAFVSAVLFGSNIADPHYYPGQKKLRKGQFALFDFGAEYKRYISDITRTFICGTPTAKQKEMYEIVLEAQTAAIDAIHAGVNGKDVHLVARNIIDKSKFKGRFAHSIGHGIGVSVHDPGVISQDQDMVLKEGMVLTVEPGVYMSGFGGVRIEDDVLVTKKGCNILTSCTKEFRSI